MSNEEVLSNVQAIGRKLLKDSTFADLSFHLDKKPVAHGHLPILVVRWKSLIDKKTLQGLLNEKKKKRGKAIPHFPLDMKKIPSDLILNQLLEFVYTGSVDLTKLQPLQVFNLLVSADHFSDFKHLQTMCKENLYQRLSLETVYELLKASSVVKKDEIRSFCMNWAADNYNDFVRNKKGVEHLELDLYQQVICELQPLKEQRSKGDNPVPEFVVENDLVSHFKELHDSMEASDCTCRVESKDFKFHRAVLGIQSEVSTLLFTGMAPDVGAEQRADKTAMLKFNPETGMLNAEFLSAEAFQALLRYYYYYNEDFDTTVACQLVTLCKDYHLNGLQAVCEAKVKAAYDTSNVLNVLKLTYSPRAQKSAGNSELRGDSIAYVLENLTDVDLHPLSKLACGQIISVDILLSLQERDGGPGKSAATGDIHPAQPSAPVQATPAVAVTAAPAKKEEAPASPAKPAASPAKQADNKALKAKKGKEDRKRKGSLLKKKKGKKDKGSDKKAADKKPAPKKSVSKKDLKKEAHKKAAASPKPKKK